jgi:hypothetical protein
MYYYSVTIKGVVISLHLKICLRVQKRELFENRHELKIVLRIKWLCLDDDSRLLRGHFSFYIHCTIITSINAVHIIPP